MESSVGGALALCTPLRLPAFIILCIPTRSRAHGFRSHMDPALCVCRRWEGGSPGEGRQRCCAGGALSRGGTGWGGMPREGPVPSQGSPSGDMHDQRHLWLPWGSSLGSRGRSCPAACPNPACSQTGLNINEPKASPSSVSLLAAACAAHRAVPAAPAPWGKAECGEAPGPPSPGPAALAMARPCSCSPSLRQGGSCTRGCWALLPPAPSPARGWVAMVGAAQPPAPRLPPTFPASPAARRGRRSQRRAVGGCVGGRWCFPSPGWFLLPPQPRSPALHGWEQRVLSSSGAVRGRGGQ